MEQLQIHIEAQPGKAHLWIACAGINKGKAEHFEQAYLTKLLPPVFHLPAMAMPLRNTRQTLALAKLEGNTGVKQLSNYAAGSTKTNPVYRIPQQLVKGIEGKQFIVNNINDLSELASVVEAACNDLLGRTGGAGFPLLCYPTSMLRSVKRGVERAGATALIYHGWPDKCCSEGEVEGWLRRRRIGEEKRVLITDQDLIRGWEASHVLVVSLLGQNVNAYEFVFASKMLANMLWTTCAKLMKFGHRRHWEHLLMGSWRQWSTWLGTPRC